MVVEAQAAFAVETLEFVAVREVLARHTSFSASHELALALVPTAQLEEARRRQATTVEALRLLLNLVKSPPPDWSRLIRS